MESSVDFACRDDALVGILHRPAEAVRPVGVLIVVGGPQYRVGSHRQFVLLARALADSGYPVFRFDYRGMGDSGGASRTFEGVEEDIRCAVDRFLQTLPELRALVVFGLCDAASAALMYCLSDQRVCGLILSNPWARSPEGEARTLVRHYYGRRLLQRSFWAKALRGELRVARSVQSLLSHGLRAIGGSVAGSGPEREGFLERMGRGLAAFRGPILLLLSGRDLTAQEFRDRCASTREWSEAVKREGVDVVQVPDADHTFSSRQAMDAAHECILTWLNGRASTLCDRGLAPAR